MMVTIIFILDRGFVVAMGGKKNFFVALLRIGIAAVMAMFLSKPVELAIFNSEIQQELATQRREALKNIAEEKQNELLKIDEKEKSNPVIKEGRRARQAYEDEVNTSIGGRKAGHGTEATKKLEYSQQQDALVAQEKQKLDAERKKVEEEYAAHERDWSENQATGMGARTQALERACEKYPATQFWHWIIFGFFMLIDCAPIIMKISMPKTTYDINEDKAKDAILHTAQLQKLQHKYDLMNVELGHINTMTSNLQTQDDFKDYVRIFLSKAFVRKYFGREAANMPELTATANNGTTT